MLGDKWKNTSRLAMNNRAIEADIADARHYVPGWTVRGQHREEIITLFYAAVNNWETAHTDENLRQLIGMHSRLRRLLKEQKP